MDVFIEVSPVGENKPATQNPSGSCGGDSTKKVKAHTAGKGKS
jgi:hypothetical protein